jgi:hypothetical protein
MVIVPLRDVCAVCDATEYVTLPLPLPLAPAVIVIQLVLLVAVQPQPPEVVTLAVREPPV